MHCSSPRASSGFIIELRSRAPSAAPAPTSVCSSSMKRTTSRALRLTSSRMRLTRPSNSPRYFVPATSGPSESASTRFPRSDAGTVPATIRTASPSTIAVFPTPGSPTSTGLFLLRRARIETRRSISSSRPMTGSSFPARANSVRSREKLPSVGVPRKRRVSSSSGDAPRSRSSPPKRSLRRMPPAMSPAAASAAPRKGRALAAVRRCAQAAQSRRRPSKTGAGRDPQFSHF